MTRLQRVARAGVSSWIAAPLCSAVLTLGCGAGSAPDPTHSGPDRAASDVESSHAPSDETTDDATGDEPKANDARAEDPGRRVVGYLQTFRLSDRPQLHLDTLTHLILAFAVPNGEGKAEFAADQQNDILQLVKDAHGANVKVLAALGGGAGGDATSARLARGVDSYVESVIGLVEKYDLDGIDVDIEGEAINAQTYEPLMLGLSKELRSYPEPKLLTAAVAGYMKENYRVLGAVDFLNIMSYDQCGDWGERTACQHSTLEQAQVDLDYWSSFEQVDETGAPRRIGVENVVLGVPFYGRCWGELCPLRPLKQDGTRSLISDLSYAHIAAYCADGTFLGCSSSADVVTDGDPAKGYYLSLNSPDTLRIKAERAQSYGGVMIWELGQDASNAALFAPIAEVFPKRSNQ